MIGDAGGTDAYSFRTAAGVEIDLLLKLPGHRTNFPSFGPNPDKLVNTPRISESAGRSCASNCSPASVGDTLRVVRVKSRTPADTRSTRLSSVVISSSTAGYDAGIQFGE